MSNELTPITEGREGAIRQIEEKVWKNISSQGIADKIMAQSHHPALGLQRAILSTASIKTKAQAFYNWVTFHDSLSSKIDTYLIVPHLIATKGPLKGTQPIPIYLNHIEPDPLKRQQLAEGIWEGVTDSEKDLLVKLLIPRKIAWYQGEGSTDPIINQRVVAFLEKLVRAFIERNVERNVSPIDGAIIITSKSISTLQY